MKEKKVFFRSTMFLRPSDNPVFMLMKPDDRWCIYILDRQGKFFFQIRTDCTTQWNMIHMLMAEKISRLEILVQGLEDIAVEVKA